jgi:hypothetical protein
MGWNAYQIAFYNSNFKNFISTDVIPDVVENGKLLHDEYLKHTDTSIFELPEKTVDLYLCPSEQLNIKFNFGDKYENTVDAVLLSPPYFDLEVYSDDKADISNMKFGDFEKKYESILTKAIKSIANENIKKIKEWKDLNPDCIHYDSHKNNLYLKIVSNSMNGINEDESKKNLEKIISSVAKETLIEKLSVL